MAVGFNASGDKASRADNIPMDTGTTWTICGFAKITSVRASAWQYFAGHDNANNPYAVLGYNDAGNLELSWGTTSGGGSVFASNPTNNEWFYFAIVQSGTGANTLKGYFKHVGGSWVSVTNGVGQSTLSTSNINLGNDGWDEYCNVHMAYVRVWAAALSTAELDDEMESATPVKAGCVMDWPLANNTDTGDDSGSGYDLTFSGTLTSETSPDLGGGTTNITPAEATQAQASDAVTIRAISPIAPAEATQAQLSDAAVISISAGILPGEATQAQTSDIAILTFLPKWYQTYWTTIFNQDQEAYVTLTTVSGALRLWARMVNPTGYGVDLRGYYAKYEAGSVTLHRYNDATSTDETLGTWSGSLTDGDKLWIRLQGAACQVYVYQSGAWSLRIDVTDSSPALETGYIGFDANNTTIRLDDFGGGNLALVVGEATQAQLSDPASIAAISVIAPAEATQTQTSDAASLVAIYLLTPGEATQAQTSDAATLGQFTPIAPAESMQAQASDAVTLTAIYPLTPAEATQAQASDAVTLAAIYPIAPAEATQSQTSDAAVVTGAGTFAIAPAEATQAQLSDAVTITAVYPVTVSEATQTQTSDAAGITYYSPGTGITPAEASQAQLSDPVTLAVIYVLAAGEATQAQISDLAILSSPVTAYPPGNRSLGEMAVRVTSVFGVRQTLEVDD